MNTCDYLPRSPPPVHWPDRSFPLSPRSTGTFSPDSSDGLEIDCTNNNATTNYYTRSQSEEHILLSPCRVVGGDSSGGMMVQSQHSAATTATATAAAAAAAATGTSGGGRAVMRNATPDLLLMTTSLCGGADGNLPSSPRLAPPSKPGTTTSHHLGQQKISRNYTLNLSTDVLGGGGGEGISSGAGGGGALSPFRNQMRYECTIIFCL